MACDAPRLASQESATRQLVHNPYRPRHIPAPAAIQYVTDRASAPPAPYRIYTPARTPLYNPYARRQNANPQESRRHGHMSTGGPAPARQVYRPPSNNTTSYGPTTINNNVRIYNPYARRYNRDERQGHQ